MSRMNYINLMKTLTETDTQKKEEMGDSRHHSLSEITELMTRNASLLGWCKADEKVKATHFFCKQDERQAYIPLNAFLFNYSIHTHSFNDLEILYEVKDPVTQRTHIMFCSLKIPQGISFFCVGIAREHNVSLTTMDYMYSDGQRRPTICCNADPIAAPFFFTISHFIFQTCKRCKKYQKNIKKCKGCWDNLGIRVSYCSKECQKLDYNRGGHKTVCGCMNRAACEKRRSEREYLGLRG